MVLFVLLLLYLLLVSADWLPDGYNVEQFLDMSERQKGFVVKAWKLDQAWLNPSIVHDPQYENRTMMVWRMPSKVKQDKIGYMWLEFPSFKIVKDKDMIEAANPGVWRYPLVGEDARVFNHNGKLYLVYNTHLTKYKRLYYAQIGYNESLDMYHTDEHINHVLFQNEVDLRHQKNWSPFDYCPLCSFRRGSVDPARSKGVEPSLLFIYSIQPHVIVQASVINATINEYNAVTVFSSEMAKEFEWKWGEMRGGSPALLINDHQYLSFFHSSGRLTHKHIITYVMGAYLFDRNPPFAITHVSPEPIVENSFVNVTFGWAYKVVDYIVFPMGFTFDDDFVYVSYGKNDRDSWMLQLNKTGLLAWMTPVKTKVTGVSHFDPANGTIFRDTYNGDANATALLRYNRRGNSTGSYHIRGHHHPLHHNGSWGGGGHHHPVHHVRHRPVEIRIA